MEIRPLHLSIHGKSPITHPSVGPTRHTGLGGASESTQAHIPSWCLLIFSCTPSPTARFQSQQVRKGSNYNTMNCFLFPVDGIISCFEQPVCIQSQGGGVSIL